jgi:3'-5' exoribonuclease
MFEMGTAFGLDAKRWEIQLLGPDSIEELLSGNPELRERQANDFMEITRAIEGIRDPRLSRLCALFIEEFGDRFKRAGAARSNHHARRGGLVEHVAGMLRAGLAIASVHSELNADLIVAGVLFHDCGKLWENGYPADGFQMPYTEYGEMLGHITIGIELINRLWKRIGAERPEWCGMIPAGDDVRLHLLHLIASHHGELQFGSPVVPKTPEAWVLHYVDNLDAKLEMMRQVYKTGKFLAPTIQERAWPLPGNAVLPLPKCAGAATLLAEEQVSAAE